MTLLALTTLLAPTALAESGPRVIVTPAQRLLPGRLLDRITQARVTTRACEKQLGLTPTPWSGRPIGSVAYARWVLQLWTTRAREICRLARHLTNTGVLRRIVDPCLAGIIRLENARWDPTIDFGWGHGNVHEAYGIPQANPGTKMASAGADWATNPLTQLRWMASYARGRYGSACAALEHRVTRGWY